MCLQAITPARITRLYRDLPTGGGRKDAGLSPQTVAYVQAVLRKAFREAIMVEQVLPANPIERAKRPWNAATQPGTVWTPTASLMIQAGYPPRCCRRSWGTPTSSRHWTWSLRQRALAAPGTRN